MRINLMDLRLVRTIIFTLILPCAIHCNLPSSSSSRQSSSSTQSPNQDPSLLSDLWTSLTQSGKSPACPGECVHAITSIFCDHVLEEISCGANYLRCCVPNDFRYGTPVETSPPLGHDLDKIYSFTDTPMNQTVTRASTTSTTTMSPTTAAPPSTSFQRPILLTASNIKPASSMDSGIRVPPPVQITSRPVANKYAPLLAHDQRQPDLLSVSSSVVEIKFAEPSTPEPTRYTSNYKRPIATVTSASDVSTTTKRPEIHPDCPGVCVKWKDARFCGNIMSNGICNTTDEACCLQSELTHHDSENLTKPLISHILKGDNTVTPVTAVAYPDDRSESTTAHSDVNKVTVLPIAVSNSKKEDDNFLSVSGNTSISNDMNVSELPNCEGTCVTPLFSLLCDEIDESKYCEMGGVCCMSKEPTTMAPTPPPIPSCGGNCIPIFFSGAFCLRPSQLIPKTSDCISGTICCSDKQSAEPEVANSSEEPEKSEPVPYPPPAINRPLPQPNLPPSLMFGSHHPSYPMPSYPFFGNRPFGQLPSNVPPRMRPPIGPSRLPSLHKTNPNPMRFTQPELVDQKHIPGQSNMFPTLISPPPMSDVPYCPSTCVSPMLRFTCFGANVLYPRFPCQDPEQICCLPLSEVHAYESNLIKKIQMAQIPVPQITNPGPPPKALQPIPQASPTVPSQVPPPIVESIKPSNLPIPEVVRIIATTRPPTTTSPEPVTSISSMAANLSALTTIPTLPVQESAPKHNPYTCGIKGTQRRESPRIVGGSDSLPGEWCWQIALINAQNQYLCGGALIGTQWVVTAAHCITTMVRNGEEIFIRVGDYDLTNKIPSRHAQTLKVSTTYIHHNHNGQTLDNDIALLKMETAVELSESVCLVCLPSRGSMRKAGKKCTVTGYGYTSETGPIALKVRAAQVPVVDDQDCTAKINAVTEKLFILPASSFCAGGLEGNDACQGDGGGPLVCESDGFYDLTGLVSWGFGCGRQDVPAVYVKISSFIGWINQIISVNNQ